jgi:hypothetical protein
MLENTLRYSRVCPHAERLPHDLAACCFNHTDCGLIGVQRAPNIRVFYGLCLNAEARDVALMKHSWLATRFFFF